MKPTENRPIPGRPAHAAPARTPRLRATDDTSMEAVVQDKYGGPDILELRDITRTDVADNDVLVRVHAAGVNPRDWHLLTGLPYIARVLGRSMGFGLRRPRHPILGSDIAGIVEAIGPAVTRFRPGDEVFGWAVGGFAEYACTHEDHLASKPARLTFEQAAAVPLAAMTALQALRDHGEVQPGQRVLINGASGGVGTFAVQVAKALGADVTAVCSTRNVQIARSIGADRVIDYTRDDFTQTTPRFDLIIDSAVSRPLTDCLRALTPRGTYVLFGDSGGVFAGGFGRSIQTLMCASFVRQTLRTFTTSPTSADLDLLRQLIDAAHVTPVIDTTYTLRQTTQALRHIGEGHARGKIVITVPPRRPQGS